MSTTIEGRCAGVPDPTAFARQRRAANGNRE
jgi:hypothetical protein